jgi:hypothetical protein
MSQVVFTNKRGLLAGAAMLIAAVAAPAHAQNVPPGSYLQSCRNVQTQGDRVVADCRRADGSWGRTALDVDRCVGGIANMDGRLTEAIFAVPAPTHYSQTPITISFILLKQAAK